MGEKYMQKKLPKVFANSLGKIKNNNTVFYSADNNDLNNDRNYDEKENKKKLKGKTVTQKINEIFSSPNYVYKANVEITLKDKKVTKRIIGRNKNYIITMDNDLIPITYIIDIKSTKI